MDVGRNPITFILPLRNETKLKGLQEIVVKLTCK